MVLSLFQVIFVPWVSKVYGICTRGAGEDLQLPSGTNFIHLETRGTNITWNNVSTNLQLMAAQDRRLQPLPFESFNKHQ